MNEPVKIDPEFQSLIPPLSPEEFQQLTENCKRDGILDSLKVWNGILIDGHNRYRIAEEWDLNYEVCDIDRPDREAVKAYIANNQLGRRNISDIARARLARIAKPEIEREAEKRIGGRPRKDEEPVMKSSQVSERENKTRYKLAKAAGMGEQKFKQCEDILDSGNEELINQVDSGKKTVNQAWLELKKQDQKKLAIGARERLEEAQGRHDEFKEQKTVSMEAIKQDQKDSAEIAEAKAREIQNALKKILFIGAATSGGDMNFSELKKNLSKPSYSHLMSDITIAISVLNKIKEWLA